MSPLEPTQAHRFADTAERADEAEHARIARELVLLSCDMSDDADRSDRLDELLIESSKLDAVHKALQACRVEVGLNPKRDPFQVLCDHVQAAERSWWQVEQQIKAEQGTVTCDRCHVSIEHAETMRVSHEVGERFVCECADEDEIEEGDVPW